MAALHESPNPTHGSGWFGSNPFLQMAMGGYFKSFSEGKERSTNYRWGIKAVLGFRVERIWNEHPLPWVGFKTFVKATEVRNG